MATRHIYIFALQGNLLDELRREVSATLQTTTQNYSPQLAVHDAIHGIAKIELVNFRESAVLLPFWTFQLEVSGITTDQIELLSNNSDQNSIETENASIFDFDVDSLEMDGVVIDQVHRLINLSNINHNAAIYIRFPVFLSSYSCNIRLRCKLITSDSWSEWSDAAKILIPPSVITKEFEVNEKILFNPLHSNHSIPGKIRRIMDPEKELYQVETGTIRQRIFDDVHSSRIYRNGPHLKHIVIDIDKTKHIQIHKHLLFGRKHLFEGMEDDYDYDLIFNTLSDIYEEYAEHHCAHFNSIQSTDYPYIGRYVANNIMDFVLETNINGDHQDDDKDNDVDDDNYYNQNRKRYNLIKCVMNHNHGLMRLIPVWRSSLNNHVALLHHHKNTDLVIVNPTEMNTKFSCDLCGIEISPYEWIFKCNGCYNVLNVHFICIVCGYNVIQQHTEIAHLLHKSLDEYLYPDCIKLIAEFVCGSVISAAYLM